MNRSSRHLEIQVLSFRTRWWLERIDLTVSEEASLG